MAVAVVDVQVNSRGAVDQLRNINNASKQAQAGIGGLTASIGKLAAGFSAIQAAKFVFAKTAEIESQAKSLEVLTGSAQKSKQIISELQRLGAVTPFTSTELIDAAKRLQAFGIEANAVVETTRRLADVSGATGAELQGLVTAYGQVQAKGRLQGEELLQFQERGIALQKELQRMYGMSGEEFRKALEKGRFSAKAVEQAIQNLTNAGGKYANGAIAQSTTLQGKFSTLQDGVDALAREIGNTLAPALKIALDDLTAFVNGFVQGLQYMQAQYRAFLAGLRGKTSDELQGQIAGINRFITANQSQLNKIRPGSVAEKQIQAKLVELRKLRGSLQKDLDKTLGLVAPQGRSTLLPVNGPATGAPPALLGETGGGRSSSKAANDAKRAAKAAAEERQRVAEVVRDRIAEGGILRINSDLQDKIAAAQAARDPMLAARLQGMQREVDLQYKYAQQLAAEKDLRAQEAIIFEGNTALIANQRETQRSMAEIQRQQDQDHMDALKKHIEQQYQLNTAVQQQKALADGIAGALGQGLTNTFDLLIQGSQSWQQSLQQIASGVLVDIANQLLRIFVIEQAINSIRAFLTPFSSTTPIGAGGGRVGNYGTLGPNYGIRQRANGGSVMAGQPYLVGERGPELFMPGRSGGIAPAGGFGGGVQVGAVNITVQNTGENLSPAAQKQIASQVQGIVMATLVNQKRSGGIL